MAAKPSYLKLLNGISSGEGQAQRQFAAWAAVTPDAELRALLHMVSVREGEHALSFEKRIIDLGFSVLHRPLPDFDEKMRLLSDPAVSDLAKLEATGYADNGPFANGADPFGFGGFFDDHSIDIATGALLGRYIAEEWDTVHRLCAAYLRLKGGVRAAA